jgi:hypothetical protein
MGFLLIMSLVNARLPGGFRRIVNVSNHLGVRCVIAFADAFRAPGASHASLRFASSRSCFAHVRGNEASVIGLLDGVRSACRPVHASMRHGK